MPARISAALVFLLSPLAAQELTLNLPPMADTFVRSGGYSQMSFGLRASDHSAILVCLRRLAPQGSVRV
jgi:hypothetical protein